MTDGAAEAEGIDAVVREVVADRPGVAEGMARLLERAGAVEEDPLWAWLGGLDWEADAEPFGGWLAHLMATAPPQNGVRAWWLTVPNLEAEDAACQLLGCPAFDPADAGWVAEACWPIERWDRPLLLASLGVARDALRADTVAAGLARYAVPLTHAALLAVEAAPAQAAALLGEAKAQGVAVGYAGGDWLPLGVLTPDGWEEARPLEGPPPAEPARPGPKADHALRTYLAAEAEAYYGYVLHYAPEDVDALLWRARYRRQLGDLDGTLEDASQALELKPGSRRALSLRAEVRAAQGDYAGAVADYDALMADLAPEDVPSKTRARRDALARKAAGQR